MNKTRRKNILRGIKGNLNRFLSIMFIVALGAGFMAGLAAASPDMYDTADAYIDEYQLFDIDVKSTLGFTDSDINAIEETLTSKGYENYIIQSANVMDMVFNQPEGRDFTSRVFGLFDEEGSSSLNHINLLEGRLPENSGECIIESVFGKYSGESVSIGDTLTVAANNSNYSILDAYMETTELTVVGICRSPMCMGIEGDTTNIGSGTINLNIYTRKDLFTFDFSTDVFFVFPETLPMDTFSQEYKDYISEITSLIKDVSNERSAVRTAEFREELTSQIETANEALEKLESIAETENKIISDTTIRMEETKRLAGELDDSESDFMNKLNSTLLLFDHAPAESSADKILSDSRKKISAAEEQLSDLRDCTWVTRVRDDLAGFNSYSENVGKVSALAKIFPVFFFIVALLVALTTMTRLIEERRTLIGTLKGLGYSNWQILSEYLLFSFSASFIGCVGGFGFGFRVFPYAISSAYSLMYFLPNTLTPLRWNIIAWVAPVTICSILLATVWACWNELRSAPSLLMVPKAPPAGKRIWLEHISFIWKRLPFNAKVTCRNLFRYKKRFIMTLIGVAGCSALLLTGFGIKDSVNDIVDKQFGQIYKYDSLFVASDDITEILNSEKGENLLKLLNDNSKIKEYTAVAQVVSKIYTEKDKRELTLFIPSDISVVSDYITMRERKNGVEFGFPSEGIVLTEKLTEELNIKIGDSVRIEDGNGLEREVRVTGITEHYVSAFGYLCENTYVELFGEAPTYNTLLCNYNLNDVSDILSFSDGITEKILADESLLYGRSIVTIKSTFNDSIKSINGVVYVLILAAGLLCIIVLYNLTNVNICERRKELATLRVLGFYKLETQHYIFKETNILSFIGALLGLIIGIWLHNFVVRTVEVNSVMFGREIKPLSYVIALAISVIFTLIVDLIMKKPINKIDMVEAMKANE